MTEPIKINDGGPAFPNDGDHGHKYGMAVTADMPRGPESEKAYIKASAAASCGMSLRDWFAGMALQGLLAYSPDVACAQMTAGHAAEDAFAYADALLAARERKDGAK